MTDYRNLSDDALSCAVKNGDGKAVETLLEKYSEAIDFYANRYASLGAEKEDLAQEGKIGVIKAAESFNGVGVFYAFAVRCIKSAMITAVRRFTAAKHGPLNASVPLSDAEKLYAVQTPENEVLFKEEEKEISEWLKDLLSDSEYTVLSFYLDGYGRGELAEKLGKSEKSIDNALQRIKGKLSK